METPAKSGRFNLRRYVHPCTRARHPWRALFTTDTSGGFLAAGDSFVEHFLQLARLEQIQRDIAATNQLALDVELWEGRPVGELGQRTINLFIFVNIDEGERHIAGLQRLCRARGESALRKIRGTLHV